MAADTRETADDAITEEELNGTATPGQDQTAIKPQSSTTNNAFTELMSPKKKKPKHSHAPSPPKSASARLPSAPDPHALNATFGRDALAAYTRDPSSFPSSRVISYDADFVTIRDLYPKSSIHLLLLPRDPAKQSVHPLTLLSRDLPFLARVQEETRKLRELVASELRRRHGRSSTQDAARNAALSSRNDDDANADVSLPRGRDWTSGVLAGVHAAPSMNHLHVHVLSADRVSESMRHRKHYNSFATPFLVPLEDFPLADDDTRWHPGRAGYLERDLACWRCGRNFGNRFKALKEHLEGEFEEWKRE